MFDPPTAPNPVSSYYQYLHEKRQDLFDLYRNESLVKKVARRGNGWTWGYRLIVNEQWATGASIGEDEINLFFDLPWLVDAKYTYMVGVAFGLSLFNLAMAKPDNQVFGIDNYSEGKAAKYARSLVEGIARDTVKNASVHVGSSPENISQCLAELPTSKKLSIVFIDGMHENQAAKRDYIGIKPYIDRRTVVLWHNTYSVRDTFYECADLTLFDRCDILHTYGVMGIYFNSEEHPLLDQYLRENSLIWNNWEENLQQLLRKDSMHPSLDPKRYLAEVVRRIRIKSTKA